MTQSKNIFLLLIVIILSGQVLSQTFDEGVILGQPGNNVEIETAKQLNFSNTYVFASSTSIDGSAFSASPTNSEEANISLYFYNKSVDYGDKLARFNASSNASEVEFTFDSLVPSSAYKLYLNNILFSEPVATSAGELSFRYSDWSENAFEIFRRRPKIKNVTITLKGDYGSVVADSVERSPGTFTDLDNKYIVMQDNSVMKGLVALKGFNSASYASKAKEVITMKKDFGVGRFLLPANTGSASDIDERENYLSNGNFLDSSRPSFTGQMTGEHTISIMAHYENTSLSGDTVIQTDANSEIRVNALSSSSFEDVVSGGWSNVSITSE